jgi:chromatin segregation and condensation protein Rec8/ScpA/Scc1 (kleisin family)
VAFLALLELVRTSEASVEQAAPFAPIRVGRAVQENAVADGREAAWNVRSA